MHGKDRHNRELHVGDWVKIRVMDKRHPTPLIARIISYYASTGHILVIVSLMGYDHETHNLEPADVELIYHPVRHEDDLSPDAESEKKQEKTRKVGV